MTLSVYLDGPQVTGRSSTLFRHSLSCEEQAAVLITNQKLIVPGGRTLSLDVSKAQGRRYSIWILDDQIPLLIMVSVVQGFSNGRIRLHDGCFLNVHIEEVANQSPQTTPVSAPR